MVIQQKDEFRSFFSKVTSFEVLKNLLLTNLIFFGGCNVCKTIIFLKAGVF